MSVARFPRPWVDTSSDVLRLTLGGGFRHSQCCRQTDREPSVGDFRIRATTVCLHTGPFPVSRSWPVLRSPGGTRGESTQRNSIHLVPMMQVLTVECL